MKFLGLEINAHIRKLCIDHFIVFETSIIRIGSVTFVALSITFGLITVAKSQELSSAFIQKPSIQLVTGNDFAPFADQSLPSGGLTTELTRRIFIKAGYSVVISFMPWKRGLRNVLLHKNEGTFPYYLTPNRTKSFIFSEPIYKTQGRVYVAKDSNFEPKTISDFKGLSFCRTLGYSIPNLFKDLVSSNSIDVVRVLKPQNSLHMVVAGRCDFVVWNKSIEETISNSIVKHEIALRSLDFTWAPTTMHFIVAKDHPEAEKLISIFNNGLQQLKDNGIYQKIVLNHMNQN